MKKQRAIQIPCLGFRRSFKIFPLSSHQPKVHNKSYFYKVWSHGLSKADLNTLARVKTRQTRQAQARKDEKCTKLCVM